MIAFLGSSHAAHHLQLAAMKRGNAITFNREQADVIFISEDTPTDANGNRDLAPILELVEVAKKLDKPIVLTSQVPPGFTRSLGITNIYHQAETLRMKDAEERAFSPDYIVVGSDGEPRPIPETYSKYLYSFGCPVRFLSFEEAEMTKICVNMFLAAQVEATNKLAASCAKVGAKWENVSEILALDKRIGKECYLKPGRWQDSKHLLRDYVTLRGHMEPSRNFLNENW